MRRWSPLMASVPPLDARPVSKYQERRTPLLELEVGQECRTPLLERLPEPADLCDRARRQRGQDLLRDPPATRTARSARPGSPRKTSARRVRRRRRGPARRRLTALHARCTQSDVPELRRLGRTLGRWQTEILAYHRTGRASNGPTEAVNLLVKRIKRVSASASATSPATGYGYCCTAASNGTLTSRPRSEDEDDAWLRRAGFHGVLL